MTKSKEVSEILTSNAQEDFEVIIPKDESNFTQNVDISEINKRIMEQAAHYFENHNNIFSRYLGEDQSQISDVLTLNEYNQLALDPQSNINKIKKINSKTRFFINTNDLIGKVYEIIESNTNTDTKLTFPKLEGRNKNKLKQKAELVIKNFNKSINLSRLIRRVVPTVFIEGNYFMYLRNNNGNYKIDNYPIGIVEVSDYEKDGENLILFNVNDLKAKLNGATIKGRNGKNIFPFNSIDEEIEENYPVEVYDGFKNKEKQVILDFNKTGQIKINDLGKKYGISNIFKAMPSLITLSSYNESNIATAKSRRKKILVQYLRKEILGDLSKADSVAPDVAIIGYCLQNFDMAYNASGNSELVKVTVPPHVEKIEYIQDKSDMVDIELINMERSKIMTALGISFLSTDSKNSFSVSDISIKQLMKIINSITRQLEEYLQKCYAIVLQENKIPLEYLPTIKILDSELMEIKARTELADFLYSKLNCSLKTAYETVLGEGEFENEYQRRIEENEKKYADVFTPHITNFTVSGKESEKPKDNDYEKTEEKQNKNKDQKESNKKRYENMSE